MDDLSDIPFDTSEKAKKVKLFSKEGFKNFREAFKLGRYGPKEWGIWTLSSLMSDAKYAVAGVFYYLWGLLPTAVSSFLKSLAIKIAAFTVAVFEICVAGVTGT